MHQQARETAQQVLSSSHSNEAAAVAWATIYVGDQLGRIADALEGKGESVFVGGPTGLNIASLIERM